MNINFNQYMDLYFMNHPSDELNADHLYTDGLKQLLSEDIFPSIQDDIIIHLHPYEANSKLDAHRHNYFELMYLSRGYVHQEINGIQKNLQEGDFCLLSPSHSHKVATSSKTDLLFNITIRPSLFNSSFLSLIHDNDLLTKFFTSSLYTTSSENPLFFHSSSAGEAEQIVQHLIMEYYEKKVGYRQNMKCYLALLFVNLLRENVSEISESSDDNNTLSEIMNYITENIHEVTLKETAEKFHYHPNYLSNLIKEHTGSTFSSLVQEARMDEVCMYLKKTNMSIEDICMTCGFSDRSSFNRQFRKFFQMSPSEYRTLNKDYA